MPHHTETTPNWINLLIDKLLAEKASRQAAVASAAAVALRPSDAAESVESPDSADAAEGEQTPTSALVTVPAETTENPIQAARLIYLKQFLTDHFEEVVEEVADEAAASKSYRCKLFQQSTALLTEVNMQDFARLLMGSLEDELLPVDFTPFSIRQSALDFLSAIYANMPWKSGQAFSYQLINLISVVGMLAFFKERYQFDPMTNSNERWSFAALVPFLVGAFINTHGFVTKVSDLSSDELNAKLAQQKALKSKFIKQLNETMPSASVSDMKSIYHQLTTPSLSKRLVVDFGNISTMSCSMFNDMALALKLLEGMPLPVKLAFGLLAGLPDALDTANTGFVAKQQEHVVDHPNQLPLPMHRMAFLLNGLSAPYLREAMAWFVKVPSPIFVSFLRYLSVKDFLPICGVNLANMRGGTLGFNLVVLLDSQKYGGYVFEKYSGPNILDFLDVKKGDNNREIFIFSRPYFDVLPFWFIANNQGMSVKNAGLQVALPLMLMEYAVLASLKYFSPNQYKKITDQGFVEYGWKQLSRVHHIDRIALLVIGAALAGVGIGLDKEELAAPGQLLFFVNLLSLIGSYSKRTMNMILFAVAEVLMYQVGFLNIAAQLFEQSNDQVGLLGSNATASDDLQGINYNQLHWYGALLLMGFTFAASVFITKAEVKALFDKIHEVAPIDEVTTAETAVKDNDQAEADDHLDEDKVYGSAVVGMAHGAVHVAEYLGSTLWGCGRSVVNYFCPPDPQAAPLVGAEDNTISYRAV